MRSVALFVTRFCITAWIGAAVLFVVVGVSEVVHPGFNSEIRDQLVVIRFPWFYRFGFALNGLALLGAVGTKAGGGFPLWRKRTMITLLVLVLAVMAAEYAAVYLPLAAAVTPPGKPRTPEFIFLHRASMWVNAAGLLLGAIAAGLVNWPASRDESPA